MHLGPTSLDCSGKRARYRDSEAIYWPASGVAASRKHETCMNYKQVTHAGMPQIPVEWWPFTAAVNQASLWAAMRFTAQ